MAAITIADFQPIDPAFPGIFFCRNEARTTSNLYLVKSKAKTMLVDSGDGRDTLDFKPDACFLTHGHFDHTRGVQPDWPLAYVHPAEDFGLPYMHRPPGAQLLPSHEFEFGPHLFEILHTPGHTPGSICLFEPKLGILFSGDTLFANGIHGRTDLGGSDEEIAQSLGILGNLDWKLVCPGHGSLQWADGRLL
ncbi:MAG: MBL fold metallo-hydrolase [Candidatus Micrarchaeota archaeon]|nr:MBL fold metallo-hydrolase [Candidatus Micrarchaeota archaeon]